MRQTWNRLQRDRVPPRSPALDYRDGWRVRTDARARARVSLYKGAGVLSDADVAENLYPGQSFRERN